MKYVMFKKTIENMTHYVPIMFPNHLVHADVAESMTKGPLVGYVVHSAGEVCPLTMHVDGRSETLDVSHDPDDKRRFLMNDYGTCFE